MEANVIIRGPASASHLLPSHMRLNKPNLPKLVLPVGKAEVIIFDDSLPGFGVRVRAGGKRTWVAQYRLGTKQRRISIGSLEKIDPDEARKRAKGIFSKVHLGLDPAVEKSEAVAQVAITLGRTADRYIKERATKRLKPKGLTETTTYLTRHWAPLRQLPLQKIKLAHVASRLNEISEQNGPYAANRARAALSTLYSWSMGEGLVESNPVIGTNKPAEEKKRDRVLTPDELRLVWGLCGSGDFGSITKLAILTAQRQDEIGAMAWREVDLCAAKWVIDASRTKNGKPHLVPLPVAAVDILKARARQDDRELIFGSGQGGFSGWSKAKAALDERMLAALRQASGPKTSLRPWRFHDLRRTTATRLGDLGVLPHVVEAILNHTSGSKAGVAGVYNLALYEPEKRAALAVWATHVIAMAGCY